MSEEIVFVKVEHEPPDDDISMEPSEELFGTEVKVEVSDENDLASNLNTCAAVDLKFFDNNSLLKCHAQERNLVADEENQLLSDLAVKPFAHQCQKSLR